LLTYLLPLDVYADDNDEEDSAIDAMYKVEPTLGEDDKILMTAALNLMRNSRNSDSSNARSNSTNTSPIGNANDTSISSKIENIMSQVPVMDVKTPYCRLSRPGNNQTVRVIPPLRGLDRKVCCSWCSSQLFCLANVIRIDINSLKFLDATMKAEDKGVSHYDFNGEYSHNNDEYIESAVSVSHSITENGLIHSSTSMVSTIDTSSAAKHVNSYTTAAASMAVSAHVDDAAVALPKSYVSPPKTSRAKPAGFKAFDFGDSNDNNDSNRVRMISEEDDLIAFTSPMVTSPIGRYHASVPMFSDTKMQSLGASIPPIQHADKSYEDSPRIPIPPLREIVHGLGGAAVTGLTPDVWSSNERPQSVEKKRWLARLSLLRDR